MRSSPPIALIALRLLLLALLVACGDVPIDDQRNNRRLFPPRGLIRGTVTYVGPRPCSRGGDIVGNAVILVFNRRNPPPPTGFATSATNFVAVPGNVLFANEPRSTSPELFCPPEDTTVEASAPFTVAPLEGGSYVISTLFDRRGRFWPTFKFRNQPEAGDIAGGFIDVEDSRHNAGNLAYTPIYRSIDIGIPDPSNDGAIPDYRIPGVGLRRGQRARLDRDGGPVGARVPSLPAPRRRRRDREQRRERRPAAPLSGQREGRPAGGADPRDDPGGHPRARAAVEAHPHHALGLPGRLPERAAPVGHPRSRAHRGSGSEAALRVPAPRAPAGREGELLVFAEGRSIAEGVPLVPALWPRVALVKLANDARAEEQICSRSWCRDRRRRPS